MGSSVYTTTLLGWSPLNILTAINPSRAGSASISSATLTWINDSLRQRRNSLLPGRTGSGPAIGPPSCSASGLQCLALESESGVSMPISLLTPTGGQERALRLNPGGSTREPGTSPLHLAGAWGRWLHVGVLGEVAGPDAGGEDGGLEGEQRHRPERHPRPVVDVALHFGGAEVEAGRGCVGVSGCRDDHEPERSLAV